MAALLLVEDEQLLRQSLTERLIRAGHTVQAAPDLAVAAEFLSRHQPDILLLDLSLPDGNGLDFYEQHHEQLEHTVVIVTTGVGETRDAVRAMKLGALDFLIKPVDQHELTRLMDRSLTVRGDRLEAQAVRLTRDRDLSMELVSESPAFRNLLEMIEEVARSEINTILLQGESGCGKNVLARHIHALSSSRSKPLLEVSCPTIADHLIESELFGHEKGAFTDAKNTRQGVFELAAGGTVVLDEISELKLDLQAKLLDVLEERRLRRVGGSREIRVDVRVIALTNRNLATMEQEGGFRQDLLFRLNIFPITVPSLRERVEDILPLTRHFLQVLAPRYSRQFTGLSRAAENKLLSYSWPGNIRELRNVIERAMLLEHSSLLQPASLLLADPRSNGNGQAEINPASPLSIVPLTQMERQMVTRAMIISGNNQSRAADLLGITRDQMRYRLKKFRLPN